MWEDRWVRGGVKTSFFFHRLVVTAFLFFWGVCLVCVFMTHILHDASHCCLLYYY